MSRSAFFTSHALPVFAHLSSESKQQLEAFLLGGNTAFREKKLLEYFKTIDWQAESNDSNERLLQKLPPTLRRQLHREVQDYRNQKSATRQESAEKREQYRLRVFEYFRIKMPSADKALLESLRDYELDLTGRDVNWRHYFTLDSFKKIDAFIKASHEERQALFAQFRKDVDTYKKNYDKIHHAQACQDAGQPFTFDDWCDMMGDEIPNVKGSRRQSGQAHSRQSACAPESSIQRAFKTLEVTFNATPEVVKKQFRKLTLSHHPDLPSGSEEKMKAIVGAYHEIQRYWQTAARV